MDQENSEPPTSEFRPPEMIPPHDLLLGQDSAAGTVRPEPAQAPGEIPPPRRRARGSPRVAAVLGVGALCLLAGILAGGALLLGQGDADRPVDAALVPSDAGILPEPTGGAGSEEIAGWLQLALPKLGALVEEMVPLYSEELTKSRAMAFCSQWIDNVEDMRTLPPAPDAVVESEFRAYLAAASAFLDACQRGDGPEARIHEQETAQHNDAMFERVDELTG